MLQQSVKIKLVVTCHFQIGYNLLKQLAASLCLTRFDNQLAINKSVDNSQLTCPQQAVVHHANASRHQLDDNTYVARFSKTDAFLAVFLVENTYLTSMVLPLTL